MARLNGKDRGLIERPKGSGIWWVRIYINGKERNWKVGAKTAARAFYRKVKTDQMEHRLFPEKYRQTGVLLSNYLKNYLSTCTKRTVREDKRFSAFWSETFPNRTMETITSREIEKQQVRLLGQGKAPGTVNRYLDFLRHIFYLAIRDDKVIKNPVTMVKRFKEPVGRIRYLTEGEEMRLKEEMAPTHWLLVAFALNTGLRQAEQFKLRWDHVDIDQKVLTIPRAKSGERRYVQLNDEAIAILKGFSSWMTSQWVFPSQKSSSPLDPRHIYGRVYMPAVRRAGLTDVNWHTLRHTFASRLVMANVDLRTVQELMGHKTIAMTQRYAHISDQHRLDAVNRLVARKNLPQNKNRTVTKTVTKTEYIHGIPS